MEDKEDKAKVGHGGYIVLISLLIVLAGFQAIKGVSATSNSDSMSVNLTLGNSAPAVDIIFELGAQDPIQSGNRTISFSFQATDVDGMGDLANTTAAVYVTGGVQTTRSSSLASCTATTINTTSINYTCLVMMWYWDSSGVWTVNASVNDTAGLLGSKISTLTFNTLTAMSLEPNNLSFGTMGAGVPTGASNDPVQVLNEGNVNISSMLMNATDLLTTGDIILASAFKMNENDTYAGTTLSNETQVSLGWGNVTAGNGTYESVYTYVLIPTGKTKATYASRRNWIMTVG